MLNNNKNSKKISNSIFLFPIILGSTFLILFSNIGSNTLDVFSQQDESEQSSIMLTAKLVDNEYRWIGANNATNPTLDITSGGDNQITIASLEGDPEEHELIIEGISSDIVGTIDNDDKGEELVATDEIGDGSSTVINFNLKDFQDDDSSNYQSLEYYCEYHPDTMRGKIQIK
jgi:hypothetical protein